jgi:hypothetical protein
MAKVAASAVRLFMHGFCWEEMPEALLLAASHRCALAARRRPLAARTPCAAQGCRVRDGGTAATAAAWQWGHQPGVGQARGRCRGAAAARCCAQWHCSGPGPGWPCCKWPDRQRQRALCGPLACERQRQPGQRPAQQW